MAHSQPLTNTSSNSLALNLNFPLEPTPQGTALNKAGTNSFSFSLTSSYERLVLMEFTPQFMS